jgi:hypothetical protein
MFGFENICNQKKIRNWFKTRKERGLILDNVTANRLMKNLLDCDDDGILGFHYISSW